MATDRKFGFNTRQLHAGQQPDPTTGSRAVPIYQTTSYQFKSTEHAANLFALQEFGNIYTRIMNPTTDVLEQRLAALEGGVGALATSSGHAAQAQAILALCAAGDHIVTSSRLYGGTYNQFAYTFPRIGIEVTFVDPTDLSGFERAIRPNTKILYGETLGNPDIAVFPFEEVAALGQKYHIPVMIDNTFATPYLNRPFEWGANIITHSTTKFLGGHGTTIGGAIVDGGNFDWASGRFPNFTTPDPSYHGLKYADLGAPAFILKARVQILRDFGGCQAPINSWLTLQGIETLSLRMERHVANTECVAQFLQAHPCVSWVMYPSLPSHPDHERAEEISAQGQRGGARLRDQGRRHCRQEVHRRSAVVQPPRKRGRRQEPGHPPGHHHAQPVERGRAAQGRRVTRPGAAERRARRRRGHPVGPGSGPALQRGSSQPD